MSDVQEIVFLGASTAFLEIIELIRDINRGKPRYKVIALLDDDVSLHGKMLEGVMVEGPLSDVKNYPKAKFVFGIGSMKTRSVRLEILEILDIPRERFVTLIHPKAKIYSSAQIGYGCIIHHGTVVFSESQIGDFTIIALNSLIGPFVKINRGCMIASYVAVLSKAQIDECVFIGTSACIGEKVIIGSYALVAMGTILARNVKKNDLVAGNPARTLGKVDECLSYIEE